MSKKKVILIGLICLLLIGGAIVALSLKGDAPEETTLPQSPGKGVVGGQAIAPTKIPEPVKQPTKESSPQAIEITVIQLYNEYYGNQISAEQKYLNKVLQISGPVGRITRDISTGKAVVYIEVSQGTARQHFASIIVECVFKNETEVASLVGGQEVTIEGKFVGGDRYQPLLRLENCSLVK